MRIIKERKYKLVLADYGEHIREADDIYVPEHFDEEGELIPEHFPEYYEMLYVSKKLTDEEIMELYVEEFIEEVVENEDNKDDIEESD